MPLYFGYRVRDGGGSVNLLGSSNALASGSNYVNVNFAGWTLDRARAELMRRIEEERSLYDAFLQRQLHFAVALDAALAASDDDVLDVIGAATRTRHHILECRGVRLIGATSMRQPQ